MNLAHSCDEADCLQDLSCRGNCVSVQRSRPSESWGIPRKRCVWTHCVRFVRVSVIYQVTGRIVTSFVVICCALQRVFISGLLARIALLFHTWCSEKWNSLVSPRRRTARQARLVFRALRDLTFEARSGSHLQDRAARRVSFQHRGQRRARGSNFTGTVVLVEKTGTKATAAEDPHRPFIPRLRRTRRDPAQVRALCVNFYCGAWQRRWSESVSDSGRARKVLSHPFAYEHISGWSRVYLMDKASEQASRRRTIPESTLCKNVNLIISLCVTGCWRGATIHANVVSTRYQRSHPFIKIIFCITIVFITSKSNLVRTVRRHCLCA